MNCADIDIITASFVPDGGDGEDPTFEFSLFYFVYLFLMSFLSLCFPVEINATGFNYQNEDEKVTLSFPSALQKGETFPVSKLLLLEIFLSFNVAE